MTFLPIHLTFAVVDLEAFGTRCDPDQQWLRERMYDVLDSAADRAGIPPTKRHPIDRGDGVALLIQASVSKPIIAEGFVRELLAGLRTHNRRSREPVAMRMRMSLHAGEASYDGRNWVGTELNTACRLVDVPALRRALLKVPTAPLALCVSDLWFRTVVRHNHGLVDHRTYAPIVVRTKELAGSRAWLHIPG